MNVFETDASDPIVRSYRAIRRKFRNAAIIAAVAIAIVIGWGIPSIQYTYRAYPTKGIPTANDKTNADYWTPFFGWRVVRADEYSRGCPLIVFVPLRDCTDLTPYRNPVTTFLLPEGFFDAP